jgi:hypothetical protein
MNVCFHDHDLQRGLETAFNCAPRNTVDHAEVLATTHRIKDGDPDSWLEEWIARRHLQTADRQAFDRELHLAELFSPALSATLQLHGHPYPLDHGSRFHQYQMISAYCLGEELDQITTPLLVADPAGESRPGEAGQLYSRLRAPKALIRPAPADHDAWMSDWLERYLGSRRPATQEVAG